MEQDQAKPPPGMAADLRRLQRARTILRAVERRTRVHRDAPTAQAADVERRLAANHEFRTAMKKLLDGGPQ